MTTKTVRIDFSKPLEGQLSEAAETINRGGLVAFPTETVYGLGASALDREAAKKIYAAKGRPSDNPLIIHIAEPEDAGKYCCVNDFYRKIAENFMPGPVTVIMPKKDIIPKEVTGGLDTVAVRCPRDRVAHTLIKLAGVPIAAPSANISGRLSPTEAETVIREMTGRIDMIIDGGESDIGLESTIVKADGDGVKLLRPGGITLEMLAKVCGHVAVDKAVTEKLSDGEKPEAPGMKYRHYAPQASMHLICGEGEGFYARAKEFLREKLAEDENIGVLCPDETAEGLTGKYIVRLGRETDTEEHARRLFSALRSFDDMPVKTIYAVSDGEKGIGLAIYNRMLKAAGYSVINI